MPTWVPSGRHSTCSHSASTAVLLQPSHVSFVAVAWGSSILTACARRWLLLLVAVVVVLLVVVGPLPIECMTWGGDWPDCACLVPPN